MTQIYANGMRKYSGIVYVLIEVGVLLLLYEPLFEWWCCTGMGKFLYGIKPSCLLDAVSLLLIVLGCGAAVELSGLLSEFGNKWVRASVATLVVVMAVESVAFDDRFVRKQSFRFCL